MKLPRLQAFWKEAAQSRPQSLAAAPLAITDRLSRAINHPVLTPKESNQLLNEINSSFRKALDESRHPNDVRPPAHVSNLYANRADHHVSTLPNLRTLLERGHLPDHGPIATFKQHIDHGTATEALAIDCLKSYISLEMKLRKRHPNQQPQDSDGGSQIWHMLKNSPFMFQKLIPDPPLQRWLTAALLLSTQPTVPFNWLAELLHQKQFDAASRLFKDILMSMKNIFGVEDTVAFFVHFIKLRLPEYRRDTMLFPQSDLITRFHVRHLRKTAINLTRVGADAPPIIANMAETLYGWAGAGGRELLADHVRLWDQHGSRFGASLSLSRHGDTAPAVRYFNLRYNGDGIPVDLKTIRLAMQVVQRLVVTGSRSVAIDVAKMMESSIEAAGVVVGESHELEVMRGIAGRTLARFLARSSEEQIQYVTEGEWARAVVGLQSKQAKAPAAKAADGRSFILGFR
ncbi:hypothetical protein TWF696_001512 [Orbilia brochopaga]|uniref:Uncharacterized protein n=1 Tax=Orbilia brochopaga TaxID=3140254 RepID=A0AAV9U9N3_9PEZI